jgi:hypothetical protein
MAALIYLADPENGNKPSPVVPSILLDSGGEYWFLYRYFESANLDRRTELIDLYGGAVIEGYQLQRLQTELELALEDTKRKPESWHVLVGWSSDKPSIETEDWRPVTKSAMLSLIASLLEMVRYSATSGLKLMSSGD